MHAEYLAFDQSCQRQEVKQICENLPNIRISILLYTLIIKTINLRYLTTLMITSEDSNAISISYFESKHQTERLNTMIAPVYIISHE